MKTISIIVTAFNEEECLPELFIRLTNVMNRESSYSWSVYVIENGSSDDSWKIISTKVISDARFRGVQLSRNFRMDGGITAGLSLINSEACIIMAADLQDPPESIHSFLRRWEEGFENIYGLVKTRHGTNILRKINTQIFYHLANKLSGEIIIRNASDFRLVDKKVYEVVRKMEERNRFVRGLFSWVGFKSVGIEIPRPERYAGVSNAHSFKVFDLALKGILANSRVPLRVISSFGFILSIVAVLALLVLFIFWSLAGVPFRGFGWLLTLSILILGLLSSMIGILGEYIGAIYDEVKKRPNFIISNILENN